MPHIANMYYADLLTAVAGETLALGDVVKVVATATGQRKLMKLANTDDNIPGGNYAVVMKYSAIQNQVESSTVPARLGSRIETIETGDLVLECRKGTMLEYDAAELGNSLNPATAGTLPTVGDALGVLAAKFETVAAATTGTGVTAPVIGRVHKVHGTGATAKVVIELVY
jgi:hypothetical protein